MSTQVDKVRVLVNELLEDTFILIEDMTFALQAAQKAMEIAETGILSLEDYHKVNRVINKVTKQRGDFLNKWRNRK